MKLEVATKYEINGNPVKIISEKENYLICEGIIPKELYIVDIHTNDVLNTIYMEDFKAQGSVKFLKVRDETI